MHSKQKRNAIKKGVRLRSYRDNSPHEVLQVKKAAGTVKLRGMWSGVTRTVMMTTALAGYRIDPVQPGSTW